MSKGDELWQKRAEVLHHLYDQGAIAPAAAAAQTSLEGAMGMDTPDVRAVLWTLLHGGAIARAEDWTLYLTPAGFREAAETPRPGAAP